MILEQDVFLENDFCELTQAVESICSLIEALPPHSSKRRAWGPHSVLAHLVYYHELYARQARASLDGKRMKLFRGTYYELNAQVVERYRAIPISKLTRRFRLANRRLGEIYVRGDPKQVIVPIKEGVQPHRLDKLVRAVTRHVRNHRIQIEMD